MLDIIENVADRFPHTIGITAAFTLGFLEAQGDVGMTWDNNPDSPRSEAYDYGRELFRVLFHRFGVCDR